MENDDGFAPMEVDEGPPQYMQGAPPVPAPAAQAFVDQAQPGPEAPMPDLDRIRRDLDELRNQPRFEQDDERLPEGDNSSDDQILDGIWKIYRTNMEVGGAPYHYPTFSELQGDVMRHKVNYANSLGISVQRLDRIIDMHGIARWLLRKEDEVAPLTQNGARADARREELERAAADILRAAGEDPATAISSPISRVKELGLLTGGRRKGKKSTHRKGKKSTHRKGKKSTHRKGKKSTHRKGKKSKRAAKKTRRR